MKVPCYKCQERIVGCHSTCDKYKQYKDDIEADKQKAKQERENRLQYRSYRDDFMRKIKR